MGASPVSSATRVATRPIVTPFPESAAVFEPSPSRVEPSPSRVEPSSPSPSRVVSPLVALEKNLRVAGIVGATNAHLDRRVLRHNLENPGFALGFFSSSATLNPQYTAFISGQKLCLYPALAIGALVAQHPPLHTFRYPNQGALFSR